jgi:hypothetical protein
MARSGKSNDERRARRYNVRDFELCCAQHSLLAALFRTQKKGVLPVVNFSVSGAQFLSDRRFSAGEKLRVEMRVPGSDDTVAVGAQVRWCQQVPRRGAFRVGVEFLRVGGTDLMRLKAIEAELCSTVIRVVCQNCRSALSVKKQYEGGTAHCPRCKSPISVAEPEFLPELATEKRADDSAGSLQQSAAERRRARLSGAFALFLQTTIRSRLHLDIVQAFAKGERTHVMGVAALTKQLDVGEDRLRLALRDLVSRGVLREIGVKTFNYDPIPSMRKHLAELASALASPDKRSEVLAVILENEDKAG